MGTVEARMEQSVLERIAGHVSGLIQSQGLKRGAPLPSYRELSAELGVAYTSVKLAMDVLVRQGVVVRQRARGCYVNRELSPRGRPLKTVAIVHTASQPHLFTQPYLTQILQGISGGGAQLDLQIYTMREQGFVTAAQLADRGVDGVILLGVESDAFLGEFAAWGLPGVVVDQYAAGIPLDFVACDNAAGAQRAVRHVVALGHRKIRFVGIEPHHVALVGYDKDAPLELRSSDHHERREAAIHALATSPGVRWDDVILPHREARQGEAATAILRSLAAQWRHEADRPTAFLVDGDELAAELIRVLTVQGVAVPADVSVCAVARAAAASPHGDALSGSCFDFVGMGRTAVELLRARCARTAPAPAVHRIGFQFEDGSTCGRGAH
jgi:DNA-binding LacI/PurR family transcriptional regulator